MNALAALFQDLRGVENAESGTPTIKNTDVRRAAQQIMSRSPQGQAQTQVQGEAIATTGPKLKDASGNMGLPGITLQVFAKGPLPLQKRRLENWKWWTRAPCACLCNLFGAAHLK